MMLHTLNSSPSDRTTFQSCAASLSEGDSLLLIEEAVYWLLPHHRHELTRLPARILALEPDLLARGVSSAGVNCVDDAGFVELAVTHGSVINWF
jgi:tRNA 2-thiouridine synthesizing protein B